MELVVKVLEEPVVRFLILACGDGAAGPYTLTAGVGEAVRPGGDRGRIIDLIDLWFARQDFPNEPNAI